MSAVPSHIEDLQRRLRDLHFTTFNGLNAIFTGGLIANLIHMVITRSEHWQQQEWILALSGPQAWLRTLALAFPRHQRAQKNAVATETPLESG